MNRAQGRARVAITLAVLSVLTLGTGYWITARMDGPWGMIPGGPFAAEEPELACGMLGAAHASALEEVEVEVHARDPRTITTWNIVVDGSMYLPADFLTPRKRWPHQVVADPRVRVRAGGRVYRCHAVRVTRPGRIDTLRDAIAAKYSIEAGSWASRTEVWWFELQPAAQ